MNETGANNSSFEGSNFNEVQETPAGNHEYAQIETTSANRPDHSAESQNQAATENPDTKGHVEPGAGKANPPEQTAQGDVGQENAERVSGQASTPTAEQTSKEIQTHPQELPEPSQNEGQTPEPPTSASADRLTQDNNAPTEFPAQPDKTSEQAPAENLTSEAPSAETPPNEQAQTLEQEGENHYPGPTSEQPASAETSTPDAEIHQDPGVNPQAETQNNTEPTSPASISDIRNGFEDPFDGQSLFPSQTDQPSSENAEQSTREEKIAAFQEQYKGRNASEPIKSEDMKEQWKHYPPTKNEGAGIREARASVESTNSKFEPHPPAPDDYRWTLDNNNLRLDRKIDDNNIKQREYIYSKEVQAGMFVDRKDQVDIAAKKDLVEEIRFNELPMDTRKELEDIFKKREEFKNNKDRLESLKIEGKLSEADKAQLSKEWDGLTTQSRLLGERATEHYASSQNLEKVFPLDPNHPSRSGEFDQIWKTKGDSGQERYVIIEAKGGGSPLGTRDVIIDDRKLKLEQGTNEYFNDIIIAMREDDDKTIKELGAQLQIAKRDNKFDYILVRQSIDKKGDEQRLGNIQVSMFKL